MMQMGLNATRAARWTAALAAVVLTWTLGMASAEAVEVSEQMTFKQAPDKVWAMVGEYGTIDSWHPAVVQTEVEGDGGSGLHRTLTLDGGGTILELLLSYSLKDRTYSYAILESPLPVANYVAHLTVAPGPDNGATLTWTSSFDAKGVPDAEAAGLIGGIYRAGFENVGKLLGM